MEMNILKYTVILILFYTSVFSQNLVPNNSFERARHCPEASTTEWRKELIFHWKIPNRATPDYFNACIDTIVGVPKNFAGNQYAVDGNAYIGLILREDFKSNLANADDCYREYIQVKLSEPLKRNRKYCVNLSYSLATKSSYAIDALGMYISREKLKSKKCGLLVAKPQIESKKGRLLKNKKKWEELCGTYTARGKEEYLTIGNFKSNEQTLSLKIDTTIIDTGYTYAYYYIDDVSVYLIENDFECACPTYKLDEQDLNLSSGGYKIKLIDSSEFQKTQKDTLTKDSLQNKKDTNRLIEFSEISNLDKIKNGDKVKLSKIAFNINDTKLLEPSYIELKRLVKLMKDNPKIKIEISGHTDNTGSEKFNQLLSKKRAESVYKYMILYIRNKTRLSYKGCGNTQPIDDNNTEKGRSNNRRVEIKIIK